MDAVAFSTLFPDGESDNLEVQTFAAEDDKAFAAEDDKADELERVSKFEPHQQLDRLPRRSRSSEPRRVAAVPKHSVPQPEAPEMVEDGKQVLPRTSPYVGFKRHAPPSPKLYFQPAPPPADGFGDDFNDFRLGAACSDSWSRQLSTSTEELNRWEARSCLPGQLPEEVWVKILSSAVELPEIHSMMCIAAGFPVMLRSEAVWDNRMVRVPPGLMSAFAPHLHRWAPVWRGVSKLVLPRSSQMGAEIQRLLPDVPVEVAWRFDSHHKGDDVEVLNHGNTVRRIAEDELVVLGDAPLHRSPNGAAPYVEVRLDKRGDPAANDTVNDFGFGVTACHPDEIHSLGAVADEVPRSWVVDFTASSVFLSIDNFESMKSDKVTSLDLCEGDRIGLRILSQAVEVYINGEFCTALQVRSHGSDAPEACIPVDSDLYPVLDLYGRTEQVSRTDADHPAR